MQQQAEVSEEQHRRMLLHVVEEVQNFSGTKELEQNSLPMTVN